MKAIQLFPNLQRRLLMAHLLWPADLNRIEVVRTLSDRTSRDRFLAFLESEFNAGTAWFALAVAQYRASPTWDEAEAIYRLFLAQDHRAYVSPTNNTISTGCPYPANLPSAEFNEIQGKFPPNRTILPPQDYFDNALTAVVKLLDRDTHKRFLADTRFGLGEIAGNRFLRALKQPREDLRRMNKARKKLSDTSANREYLKRELRAASFDLYVMGLVEIPSKSV
jgi:hypothetical protein